MAKALMITGTHSSAGKSLFVTALGRILYERGYKVAPFKAQNMSLQSYVCKDGAEIGLAQALQAKACGVEPEYAFNPILLKPEGSRGFQVVLKGRAYKTVSASEYYKEKDFLWREIREILDYLKDRFEILLLEGAGSPAEINLLEVDLVNIKPALFLKAPVLIIGDIEKGGVFASLYGTKALLEIYLQEYAKLIKGYIINKFRGNLELLTPGLEKLSKLSGLPCLGVLPYDDTLSISDEDGFSFFNKRRPYKGEADLRIVVLPLKHLSNFSDFDPFYLEEDVELIYSFRKEDILQADIVIIPGSKNTFSDLKQLQELNFRDLLMKALERDTEIIGICGGFQMLGEVLYNPYKVEGEERELRGLGLLEISTTFFPEKITTQVLAKPLCGFQSSEELWGYEIHKGISEGDMNLFEAKRLTTGEVFLEGRIQGSIWGTYLHGIFTNDTFRRELLNRHRLKKGLKPIEVKWRYHEVLEHSLNRLADLVERHLNIEKILKILGI